MGIPVVSFGNEGPWQELLMYILDIEPKKNDRCFVYELVPLKGEKNSKPHPQSKIVVPLLQTARSF